MFLSLWLLFSSNINDWRGVKPRVRGSVPEKQCMNAQKSVSNLCNLASKAEKLVCCETALLDRCEYFAAHCCAALSEITFFGEKLCCLLRNACVSSDFLRIKSHLVVRS